MGLNFGKIIKIFHLVRTMQAMCLIEVCASRMQDTSQIHVNINYEIWTQDFGHFGLVTISDITT